VIVAGLVLASCGSSVKTAPVAPAGTTTAPPVSSSAGGATTAASATTVKPDGVPARGGPSCSLTYSGAVSGTIDDKDAIVSTSYWAPTLERGTLLVVACTGATGSLTLGLSLNTDETVLKEAPGTFTVGGFGGDQQIDAAITIGADRFEPNTPGQLQITAFDAKSLTGTFSFSAVRKSDNASVDVKGTFSTTCQPSAVQVCK
jgi:hypothetical protein